MSTLAETLIVAALVSVALVWGGRAAWRSWKKGMICSSCADAPDCPLAGKKPEPTELQDIETSSDCQK